MSNKAVYGALAFVALVFAVTARCLAAAGDGTLLVDMYPDARIILKADLVAGTTGLARASNVWTKEQSAASNAAVRVTAAENLLALQGSNTAARAATAQAQATANAALTPAQAATLTVAEARKLVQEGSNAWLVVTANAATLYQIVPSGSITTLVVSATSGVGYNGPPQGTLLGFVPAIWSDDYGWWEEPSWTNGLWNAYKAVNPPLGQPKGWGVFNEHEDHPEFWGIDASAYTLPATISGHDGAVGTLTLSVASVTAGVATNAYPLARAADLITPAAVTNIVEHFASSSFPSYDWGLQRPCNIVISNGVMSLY